MSMEPRLDIIGAALADPSRMRILCVMMDGRAFTNKELACAAGISAQTASVHLKRLAGAGLTTALRSGRCVYHRIANDDVAQALEALAVVSPPPQARTSSQPRDAQTRRARCCFSHLAGRLGVLVTGRMIDMDVVRLSHGAVVPGRALAGFQARMGLARKAAGAKLCLDWTERRHHLSGPLAIALLQRCLDAGWVARERSGRALQITPEGYDMFQRDFGLSRASIDNDPS
ncbi:MAG TPA: transcriptional regulator [Aliiroseovarius sp.]|nr:transcriptional regulator [Aliiroseovarius sp.]